MIDIVKNVAPTLIDLRNYLLMENKKNIEPMDTDDNDNDDNDNCDIDDDIDTIADEAMDLDVSFLLDSITPVPLHSPAIERLNSSIKKNKNNKSKRCNQCHICKKMFARPVGLNIHITKMHGKGSR